MGASSLQQKYQKSVLQRGRRITKKRHQTCFNSAREVLWSMGGAHVVEYMVKCVFSVMLLACYSVYCVGVLRGGSALQMLRVFINK